MAAPKAAIINLSCLLEGMQNSYSFSRPTAKLSSLLESTEDSVSLALNQEMHLKTNQ